MGGRVLAAISLLIALGQMSVRKSRAGGRVELKPGACCRCEQHISSTPGTGPFLEVQWLRIHLPVQGTEV